MNFTRVSKAEPCPLCGKPDWCRVFSDGWVECMRVQSGTPAKSGGWMQWVGGGERGAHGATRPLAVRTDADSIPATCRWG